MSGVFEIAPRLSGRLMRLEAEHATLHSAFEAAHRAALDTTLPPHEIVSRIKAAILLLRRHEAAENQCILRAFWVDLGGD
jgi:hypothetical protein